MHDFTLLYNERVALANAGDQQLSPEAASIFENSMPYMTEDTRKIFLGPGNLSELETPEMILLAHIDTWMATLARHKDVFDAYEAGDVGRKEMTSYIRLQQLCECVIKRVVSQKTTLIIMAVAECLKLDLYSLEDADVAALGDKVSGAMLEQIFALYEHNHDLLPLDLTELAFIPAATLFVHEVVSYSDERFKDMLDELAPRIKDKDTDGKILEVLNLAIGRIAKREQELGRSLRRN